MTDTYRSKCEAIYIENIQLKSELEKYRKAVEVYKESNDFYADRRSWNKQTQTTWTIIDKSDRWDGQFWIGGNRARQAEAKVKGILG